MSSYVPSAPSGKHTWSDRLLFSMIVGCLSLRLFLQTMLNIAPVMANDLQVSYTIMNM